MSGINEHYQQLVASMADTLEEDEKVIVALSSALKSAVTNENWKVIVATLKIGSPARWGDIVGRYGL